MRSRLRCVKGCAAMAAPLHMPVIACAPHRRNRPAAVAVGVAVRAAGWRHDHPSALGGYEVANKWLGNSSRGSATATLYPEPPTMNVRKSDKDSEDR